MAKPKKGVVPPQFKGRQFKKKTTTTTTKGGKKSGKRG